MRISEVRYEQLESGPGYNNRRVGVTVLVGADESAQDALAVARGFVAKAIGAGPLRIDADEIAKRLRELADDVVPEIPF